MRRVRYPRRFPPSATGAHLGVAAAVFLAYVNLSGVARAQTTKTFIDYIKPAPIVCSPLSSATWGVAGVLPRDTCNGIESARGAAVPPEFYYWDGQILKAKDGKYHMFMSTWSGTAGFNPGWTGSDAYHAISAQGVLGPYQRQGYVYDNNGTHKGHNVSAVELTDGTYAVVVSETVAFTIYRSSSLDGPWTGCTASIQTNGVNAGTDAHYDSNVSLFPRHDGRFQIVQRHGLIAIADTLCGPYRMQKPTWTYPTANRPTIDSIYPRRTSIPGVSNPTYAWEEDPHIWRSGGIYHVLYSGSGDRVGWHLYSPDGINNWTDGGLSCDPRLYEKIFGYEGSTTHTQWYKMERPGVVLEGGSIDVNGCGTLLTTESCLLNPNRNPQMDQNEISRCLREFLGVEKVIWLGEGIVGDDTDGHVDDLTRFVSEDTVVTVTEEDPADGNFQALRENRERLAGMCLADGRPLKVIELPMPEPRQRGEDRLPASYANFYIGNRVVLLPVFGCPQDEEAAATLSWCFPGRRVVAVDCRDVVVGLGTLHCLTQQVPAV